MDIRLLEYYLVVSQEGNITRAAQILHLTQPTLSRQMKLLEEQLGTRLFERTNHNVRLTNNGMLFRRRALSIVETYHKATEEVSESRERLNGMIVVGAIESCAMEELAGIMSEFQKLYPLVKFELITEQPDELKAQLESEALDLALLPQRYMSPAFSCRRMNAVDEWGVLVHRSIPCGERLRKTDILQMQKLVVLPRTQTPPHYELTNWYGEMAALSDFSTKYNSLSNAVVVARHQSGLVFCMRSEVAFEDMRFVPLEPPVYSVPILVWKKDRVYSKTVQAFIHFLE